VELVGVDPEMIGGRGEPDLHARVADEVLAIGVDLEAQLVRERLGAIRQAQTWRMNRSRRGRRPVGGAFVRGARDHERDRQPPHVATMARSMRMRPDAEMLREIGYNTTNVEAPWAGAENNLARGLNAWTRMQIGRDRETAVRAAVVVCALVTDKYTADRDG